MMIRNEAQHAVPPSSMEALAVDLYRQACIEGISLRLFGSVAIRLHCPREKHLLDQFKRIPKDIDIVVMNEGRSNLRCMLDKDWGEDMNISASTEGERLRFNRRNDGLCLDVSVNELRYSQVLPLKKRFSIDSPTLSVADLLLSKLQASSPTISDLADIAILLLEHTVGHIDDDEKNIDYIAEMAAQSWRWFHAIEVTARRVHAFIVDWSVFTDSQKKVALGRLHDLTSRASSSTKTFYWHMRRIFGEAVPWYLPVSSM